MQITKVGTNETIDSINLCIITITILITAKMIIIELIIKADTRIIQNILMDQLLRITEIGLLPWRDTEIPLITGIN